MKALTREDLMGLEEYAANRDAIRSEVMAHKKNRIIPLGPNMTLHFEDVVIMRYQIQEMLRAERIFEAEGIQEELDTYNALIPDGRNWKATMMIEFADPQERAEALKHMLGIEHRIWVQVAGHEQVFPITDEDLERETEEKTSSVHFLRFELSEAMAQAAKDGQAISLGVDHDAYRHVLDPLPQNFQDALTADLD